MSARTTVEVGGRELSLSNLDKVLYPPTGTTAGTTKAEVIEYYARIAPTMLPHLSGRCITLKRFPDGVEKEGFFEKRCPKHRPEWMGTALGPGDRNGDLAYCRMDEAAGLVWAANMAALELHVPMALAADLDSPRAVVFDFDPGAPAAMKECCEIAMLVHEILDAVNLQGFAKTSGSKGLQLYVPLNTPCTHQVAADFALAVGQLLEHQHRERVTTTMAKAVRPGKVFVDWSQNARFKTTIGVYSLRARPEPTCSTPVTWGEVSACAEGAPELRFTWREVLARVDELGDLFEPVLTLQQTLPGG
ncbi:MAG: non-homologous end-joining DNA ligase [Ilumatobacteraceae bacterium]|nr:non-homologous end-joining DNA ligase [Ilumatobacteraceae bacterium]